MRKLTAKNILEFYDVPQLFVATDAMDINYLCVLYNQENNCEYLAVQVSALRLQAFLASDIDLRNLYLHPEQDDTLYHVTVSNEQISADRIIRVEDITEEMLPAPGFYYAKEDATPEVLTESIELQIPSKDRSFFADIANRMGWSTKIINNTAKRIAML